MGCLTVWVRRERDLVMQMRRGLVIGGLVVATLGLGARSRAQLKAATVDDGAESQAQKAEPASSLSPAEVARRALVIEHFGSTSITVGELEDAIREKIPFMQERYLSAEAVRAMLDRSVRFELLAAEARRLGYDKHEAVALAVKQNLVQALIKAEFDDKFTAASVPDADVKKYYDEHRSEFERAESRRASLLIVDTEADAKTLLPLAKLDDMREFRELVRTKSVDPTNKLRGGDLGYFDDTGHLVDAASPLENVDAALAKATFALKTVGDTSGVLHVGQRFAIVRLAGLRPAQRDTPKAADERIRTRLWRERRQAAIDAKVAALRASVKPEVHPELVDAVKLELAPALPPGKGMPQGFPQTRAGPVMTPPAE